MHKFYNSIYDASVYLQQPEQNSGRDEILEVGKTYYGSTKDIHRAFIKFDMIAVSESIANGSISGSFIAYLNFKSANAEEIPLEYTIYANAVSQSWSMGTGTKFDNISSDGVSWKYRDGINSWQENTIAGTAVFTLGTTGSANAEGGTWYTASQASQSFSYEPDDIRMDVTNIIHQWISGSLPNNGFIVRHSIDAENDTQDYGVLKFFSKETNTIYEPTLEFLWNDFTFNTGSLLPVTGSAADGDYKVVLTTLKKEYLENTKIKIRVKGRDLYPTKDFGQTFQYDQSKYLPATTYYQIEDYRTNEILIPFSDYTKVSCDSISNYFHLDLNTFSIDRMYRIKLKIVENGDSTIIDERLLFDII